ncbi:MAG: hypothetical protein ACRD16_11510 [Thermoanaerobaculia bacterium]
MKKAAAALLALGSVFSPARRVAKKGVEEFRAKRYAEAQRDFREATSREPADPTWNFDLGTALAAAGEGAESRSQLARAAASPDAAVAARALYQMGTLDLQARKYEDASNELRRSLELSSGDVDAKRNFEIASRNRRQHPPPPPKGGGGAKEKPPGSKPQGAPNDSEFQRKAGMTRAQAEALLRSLEDEQKQRERVAARAEGKDW